MVSTLTWVLVGIVVYTLAATALRARGLLPEAVRVSGPITTLHTKRGRDLLDRLSRRRRFWRATSNFGLGVALVVMVGFGLVVFASAERMLTRPEASPIERPQDFLVIPGVNQFLPLAAAPDIVAGLGIAMVVHEGAHGLLCRVEDIEIESMGLALFTIVPIGAFVEPDEESQEAADRGGRSRMFAAGVTANFAVTLLVFVLLFGPVVGSISVVEGVPVGSAITGSAADAAGVEHGDVIVAVGDGEAATPVANASEFRTALDRREAANVSVALRDGGTREIDRHLTLIRASPELLAGVSFGNGEGPPTVRRVNDTLVRTEREFRIALEDRTVAEIGTDRGTATIPVGAYAAAVAESGPLATAGAPAGEPLVVTRIGDERIVNASGLTAALAGRDSGETVPVEVYADGTRHVFEVSLGERDGEAFLGVAAVRPGFSSMVVDDVGVDPYPARQFLTLLGKDVPGAGILDGTFLIILFRTVLLPFFSFVPGFTYAFPGFVGGISNFYVVDGPLGLLGGFAFTLANVLFWTGWVNINLGIFNCLPAYPLDGGHILRASVEAVVSRLPIPGKRRVTLAITVGVSLSVIVGLVLMIFGPVLLAGG